MNTSYFGGLCAISPNTAPATPPIEFAHLLATLSVLVVLLESPSVFATLHLKSGSNRPQLVRVVQNLHLVGPAGCDTFMPLISSG
ncbi:MAG: hypothetical protein LBP35_03560 [Candidatus Ancillula trichonymphae]|nr:hypothetical protein [Candidatus Ancillula trichonymphae]